MPTIVDMTEYRTVTDAKAHLNEIVEALQDATDEIVITRHGKPAAIVMSWRAWEGFLETIDVLATPGALDEIKAAQARMDAGECSTLEDIERDLKARSKGRAAG